MSDREKVAKGIHQHCEGSMFDRCGECPYYEIDHEPFVCRDMLLNDLSELLKEQEAKPDGKCVNECECWDSAYERGKQDALKEQEDEKKRIMKVIWDTLHEGLSIDTVADQDWVYEQIRHRIEDT